MSEPNYTGDALRRFVAWKRELFDRGDGPRSASVPTDPAPTCRYAIGESTPYGRLISVSGDRGTFRAFDHGVEAGDWNMPLADLEQPAIDELGRFRVGVVHWHRCPICHVSGGEICRLDCTRADHVLARSSDGEVRMHGAVSTCAPCRNTLDNIVQCVNLGLDYERAAGHLTQLQVEHKVGLVFVRAREAVGSTADLYLMNPLMKWAHYAWDPMVTGPSVNTRLTPLGLAAFGMMQHAVLQRAIVDREKYDLVRLSKSPLVGLSAGSAELFLRGLVDIGINDEGRPLVLLNPRGKIEYQSMTPDEIARVS